MEETSVFQRLYGINVNEHTEKKEQSGGISLTYLSWTWAWAKVMEICPDATYTIWKDENNRPYIYDPNTGYMVYTTVTIGGKTHEMWLPVMDGANRAMKAEPYTVKTRYKEFVVQPATMMDINKAIMRCLTKNLAMFGLGLYIYAGEDLPITEADEKQTEKKSEKKPAKDSDDYARAHASEPITVTQGKTLKKVLDENGIDTAYLLDCCGTKKLTDITNGRYLWILQNIATLKEKYEAWKSKQS